MVEGELNELLKFIADEFHFFGGKEYVLSVEGIELAEDMVGICGILECRVLSSEESHLS